MICFLCASPLRVNPFIQLTFKNFLLPNTSDTSQKCDKQHFLPVLSEPTELPFHLPWGKMEVVSICCWTWGGRLTHLGKTVTRTGNLDLILFLPFFLPEENCFVALLSFLGLANWSV